MVEEYIIEELRENDLPEARNIIFHGFKWKLWALIKSFVLFRCPRQRGLLVCTCICWLLHLRGAEYFIKCYLALLAIDIVRVLVGRGNDLTWNNELGTFASVRNSYPEGFWVQKVRVGGASWKIVGTIGLCTSGREGEIEIKRMSVACGYKWDIIGRNLLNHAIGRGHPKMIWTTADCQIDAINMFYEAEFNVVTDFFRGILIMFGYITMVK